MKINLAIIVKDDSELNDLKRVVQSAVKYVDGVYITANGKNVKGIKRYCDEKRYNYSYIKWNNDFSEARNFNFEQAKDCDYIFWLDSDDLLVGGENLRDIAQTALNAKKDLVFFTYWYGCTFSGSEKNLDTLVSVDMQHPRERLIRPGSNIWQGRLHETPVPNNCEVSYTHVSYTEELPIAVMHTADTDKLADKMERNMTLLEQQLEEEKANGEADPRTLLYLMKIYNELDVPDVWRKCLDYGREYIGKSGWDMERGVCWDIMAQCVSKLGDNKTALLYWFNSLREWPYDNLIYLRIADAYFKQKQFGLARHWLEVALKMEPDQKNVGLLNIKAMKVLAAETMLNLAWNADKKDTNKALEAANLLYKENPTEQNGQNLAFISDMKDLNDTCERIDKTCEYFESIDDKKSISKLIEGLPQAISAQPFAIKWLQKIQEPRVWEKNEICYFANMGMKHFFKWDGNSIKNGVGGSETAVIKLAEEWTKLGYKVTVYGDPESACEINGVTYLPYYHFNKKDKFNIFIQWRNGALAELVEAEKFYIDLHDVFSGIDYTPSQIEKVDKFMVKSRWHRKLAPNIPDDKFMIIGNGVAL